MSRLKQDWESPINYAYVWAEGVYSNVRMDDRLGLLVVIGPDENGKKEPDYKDTSAATSCRNDEFFTLAEASC